jgi:hypothetical protein
MKLSRFVTLTALLFALLINYSCDKSDKGGPPVNNPPENITADVYGRVTDDNNVPVQGATVKAGTASTSTDVNGYFRFRNASLDKSNGFIKVEKEGFFQGSRTFTPNAGTTNYVSIQLIKKIVSGTFPGASGGNITVSSGGSINFPANGVVNTANNSAYTGNVSVYAYFINPTAARFREMMPGALRGINTNNQPTGLKSYGMMAVELFGSGGEKLQLANGKSATILFPIPTTLQAQAPATIPLWIFNDTTGVWKQEGSATKQGSSYSGTVTHFSFWNCDDPFPVVDFTVTIKDPNGTPLRYGEVVLKIIGDTLTVNGYTDSTGKVSGPVPVNKAMQMQVYNRCGLLIHTQQIGPFAAATNLGTITIPGVAPVSLTISGSAVNCSGAAVTNGVLNVALNNNNYRTNINNGSFSIVIDRCDLSPATAKLQAIDFNATQQGPLTDLSVTSGTANAGQLSACGDQINQFITYTVGTLNVSLLPPDSLRVSRSGTMTSISGYHPNQSNYTYFQFPGNAQPGTYAIDSIYIESPPNFTRWKKSGTINITITEYGAVGGIIAGSFTGNVFDQSNPSNVQPIVCNFRVKRR